MTKPDASTLIALFHHKWSSAILAEMAKTGGARGVVLRQRLGASQQAISAALARLIEMGLVTQNPGYGHPLRPEYVLTPEGQAAAAACARIVSATARLGVPELAGFKWHLPILWTLGEGPLRFREIARRSRPITDRSLSQSLTLLTDAELVRARLLDVRPPAPAYEALPRARNLIRALTDLAA